MPQNSISKEQVCGRVFPQARPLCKTTRMNSTNTIKVNILLHGISANYSGEAEIPAECTVGEAIAFFAAAQGTGLSEDTALICMVDGQRVSKKTALSHGDRLEVYQILGGG